MKILGNANMGVDVNSIPNIENASSLSGDQKKHLDF